MKYIEMGIQKQKKYLLSNPRGLVTPVTNVKVNDTNYSLPRDYFKDLYGK